MNNFPFVQIALNKSWRKNRELHVFMPQLDDALEENQQIRQEMKANRSELKLQLFNASMYEQAVTMTESERACATKAQIYADMCYKKFEHILHLFNEANMDDILSYTVKCLEEETIRDIAVMTEKFQAEAGQLEALENRIEVSRHRELQSLVEESQNELLVAERELANTERQMAIKMERAYEYRKKRIITILETRTSIANLQKTPIDVPIASPSQDNAIESMRTNHDNSEPSNGPILQSGLDFLNNFMESNGERINEDEIDTEEDEPMEQMELRPILHRRNSAPSPFKQVRFVAPPHMERVRYLKRIGSSSDDGPANLAYLAPELVGPLCPFVRHGEEDVEEDVEEEVEEEVEMEEYEQDECDDQSVDEDSSEEVDPEEQAEERESEELYRGEEETEEQYEDQPVEEEEESDKENEYQNEEEEEEEEESDKENDYQNEEVEEEQEEESDKENDYQNEEVEEEQEEESDKENDYHNEEESNASSEEPEDGVQQEEMREEVNPKKSQMNGPGNQNSGNKNKPKMLSAVVIPSPKAGARADHSTSSNIRFKLTTSRKSSRDLGDDEDPFQFKRPKMNDDNENEDDENEIPMAQPKPPKPQQIEEPSPVVSPPSSDRGESMLNFSPNRQTFTDDFWLNEGNTDDNNTTADYNL